LHYTAKRFFAPVLISCERKGFSVRVNVTNETLSAFHGQAQLTLIDAKGNILSTETVPVEVSALASTWVHDAVIQPSDAHLHPEDRLAYILRLMDGSGNVVSENCELFTTPKFFEFTAPGIEWKVTRQGKDCVIEFTALAFAWGVWLETKAVDCRFSDNCFFLLSGEMKTIFAYAIAPEVLLANLSVTSITDLSV